MKSKICVPIPFTNLTLLTQQLLLINSDKIDLLEFRLDYYENEFNFDSIDNIFYIIQKYSRLPYIITLRTQYEGGYYQDSIENYLNIYQYIIEKYSCYAIDIEWHIIRKAQLLLSMAKEKKIKCIVSYHNFNNMPDNSALMDVYQQMKIRDDVIYKIAVMPQNEADIIRLLTFTNQLDEHVLHIIIGMGHFGQITRIMPHLFKSILTFATIDKTTAPGQLPVNQLFDIMKLLSQ